MTEESRCRDVTNLSHQFDAPTSWRMPNVSMTFIIAYIHDKSTRALYIHLIANSSNGAPRPFQSEIYIYIYMYSFLLFIMYVETRAARRAPGPAAFWLVLKRRRESGPFARVASSRMCCCSLGKLSLGDWNLRARADSSNAWRGVRVRARACLVLCT